MWYVWRKRKPKQIMQARMEERRKGRLRVTYEDNIKEIARRRGKGMGELKRLAKERVEWRKWIMGGSPGDVGEMPVW